MQTSLHNQLLTLNLKMDTGLQAIDQLSQLLILLIAELQGTGTGTVPEAEPSAPIAKSPLLQTLLEQLSLIRQELQRSSQPIHEEEDSENRLPTLADPLTQNLPEAHLLNDRKNNSLQHSLQHKDVLEDDDSFGLERTTPSAVSADMQVRRLMAQLTAAYNRIAALEEQLLSSHRPSYASSQGE